MSSFAPERPNSAPPTQGGVRRVKFSRGKNVKNMSPEVKILTTVTFNYVQTAVIKNRIAENQRKALRKQVRK
jgi:hypothetical protein